MIPKTIHYCWFGGNPLPKQAQKCIESWKKYCPEYDIVEWNENNFDLAKCPEYVRDAYSAKKFAFASDYVRLKVLYEHGGFYMDTDVELLKSLNKFENDNDLCKIDTYVTEMRNVKEDGVWVQKPYYMVQDKLPYGHGEKSVYIANGFIRLTREEAMCINWHMGEYDMRAKAGVSLSDIYYKYPTAFIFHIADNMTTYLDEKC